MIKFKKWVFQFCCQFLLFFFIICNTQAGVLGPSNYNECVLQNIKSTANTIAAIEVKKSCALQFPKTVPLDEVTLIIYVINSGEIMLNSHYKVIYKKYYSNLEYESYLRKVYEKKDRIKYQDISFEEFLELIGYKEKK